MRHFVPSSLLLLIEKALSSHQLLSMFEICWLLSWVSHLHKTSSNHHVISIFIQLILNIHWEMLKDDWLSPFPYIYIKCLSMWLVWNHWALLLCGFLGTGKILENFDILGKEFSFNKSWNNFVTTVLSWNLHNLIIQFIFITQDNLWFKPSPANTVFVCVCVCQPGQEFYVEDCKLKCRCDVPFVTCVASECDPMHECKLQDGILGCHPTSKFTPTAILAKQ